MTSPRIGVQALTHTATFSPCRTWRYTLTREIGGEGGTLMVIGLNPSTADETKDDPTIRRCVGFARSWGASRLVMTNLFAYRSTSPVNLYQVDDPIGPDNDRNLYEQAAEASIILAAWGVHGRYRSTTRSLSRPLAAGCGASASVVASSPRRSGWRATRSGARRWFGDVPVSNPVVPAPATRGRKILPGPNIEEAKRQLVRLIDLIDNYEIGEGGVTVGDFRGFAHHATKALEALGV